MSSLSGGSWRDAACAWPELEGRGELGDGELRLTLERDAHSPALARAAVRAFTEECELSSVDTATLTLLVSELVSNAVLHSDASPTTPIVLRARVLGDGGVRVDVTDRGSGFTAAPRDRPELAGGFGLHLVDDQARRWGVDRPDGTRVWFEL